MEIKQIGRLYRIKTGGIFERYACKISHSNPELESCLCMWIRTGESHVSIPYKQELSLAQRFSTWEFVENGVPNEVQEILHNVISGKLRTVQNPEPQNEWHLLFAKTNF